MLESKFQKFNHLKIHTQYSICEGAIKIDDLKEFSKENKIKSLAISDTSNLCGALEFSEKLSKIGTQPIIGTQINFRYEETIGLLPLLLIFKQPDYGTGLMYLLPMLPMLYWSGVKFKILSLYLFPILSMLAAMNLLAYYTWMVFLIFILVYHKFRLVTIIFNFIINITFGLINAYAWTYLLKDYHKGRIIDFMQSIFNPENSNLMGIGYQAFQSKVAIGSGGFLGKGLGEGTQSYLRFLPIKDSDFILSVISEEMGLFLVTTIVITFLVFLYFVIDYAQRLFNKFYSLCLVGFCSILFFHIIINMSMVSGLFPVIGLPFPFISYGGSFMLSCFIMIAIINNIINNDL